MRGKTWTQEEYAAIGPYASMVANKSCTLLKAAKLARRQRIFHNKRSGKAVEVKIRNMVREIYEKQSGFVTFRILEGG